MVYLASDHAKDLTGKTFLAGAGQIAEMKVVTAEGITKKEDGGLWTADEIASKMKAVRFSCGELSPARPDLANRQGRRQPVGSGRLR